jgi:hypothetical protein
MGGPEMRQESYAQLNASVGKILSALPLDGDDGQRRYRLGSIILAREA